MDMAIAVTATARIAAPDFDSLMAPIIIEIANRIVINPNTKNGTEINLRHVGASRCPSASTSSWFGSG
jgi:hypothetical protein